MRQNDKVKGEKDARRGTEANSCVRLRDRVSVRRVSRRGARPLGTRETSGGSKGSGGRRPGVVSTERAYSFCLSCDGLLLSELHRVLHACGSI
jgi:hypothetical protein